MFGELMEVLDEMYKKVTRPMRRPCQRWLRRGKKEVIDRAKIGNDKEYCKSLIESCKKPLRSVKMRQLQDNNV